MWIVMEDICITVAATIRFSSKASHMDLVEIPISSWFLAALYVILVVKSFRKRAISMHSNLNLHNNHGEKKRRDLYNLLIFEQTKQAYGPACCRI